MRELASPWVYDQNHLMAEGVPLRHLAEQCGTPFYCLSATALEARYLALREALDEAGLARGRICYSLKANASLALVRLFTQLGAGADIVSVGELLAARAAGMAAEKIVFSGTGKRMDEIEAALKTGIGQFNIESKAELAMIESAAARLDRIAPVAFRVNPASGAGGHDKITTGRAEDKFGIALEAVPDLYRRAAQNPNLRLRGLAVHIGSQVENLAHFEAPFKKLKDLAEALLRENLSVPALDLGGGLPVSYASTIPTTYSHDVFSAYATRVDKILGHLPCEIIFEPGRALAAPAGILVAQVILRKSGQKRDFLVLDAGMNDFLRPALYDAEHAVLPETLSAKGQQEQERFDLVGPVCESSDVLARDVPLPPVQAGDLLVFLATGAYGSVQASAYNMRPPPAELMVKGKQFSIIRPRLSPQDLFSRDVIPSFIAPA